MRTLSSAICAVLALAISVPALAQVARPLPVVQRLEPTSGPPGTEVILVGRHFDDAQTVWLGESQLEIVSRLPSRWTVRVPAGAPSGAIEIRTARGNVTGPRFRVSEAPPAPVIAGFAPANAAPGTEVVIRGENFSPRLTENQVHLGTLPVVVRNATPTELTVIVPQGAQAAPFRVQVTGAGEATSAESFGVGTGTTIASFEPVMGPPGTRVTIRGTGFSRRAAQNRVYLGEQRARVRRATETELEVELPRAPTTTSGRFLVDVQRGGRAHSATEFAIRFPPTIASFDPASGAPGTRVTLTGQHFGTDVRQVRATMGETVLTVRDLADDRLVVEIPAGAASGPVEVTVAGLGPARTRGEVAVLEQVAVEGFAPRSGGPGTVVTITGRGFSPQAANNTVRLSGTAAEVVRATATSLEVRIPSGAGSGPLIVAVANAGESRTPAPFVITRAPTIAGFEPASGPPGTAVMIRGTNFGTRQGLIDVRIGDRQAQVRRATDTELEVVVPPGATTAPLRVTVRLQGSATTPQPFTVTSP